MNPVEFSAVFKSFKGKAALRGVDIAVEPATIVGIVGPNGSGKTTCLRIMLGLLRQDAGNVRVLGMNPAHDSLRIRQHCCYLPGETSLYQNMRGAEFLHFALSFYPRLQDEVMTQLMEAFQLPLQKKVRSYSAGMKQQLALMANLIPDVELYILDEPDRALDATTRFFLREVFRQLRGRGKTFLLSSHHLQDLESVADDLVFVLDGATVSEKRIADAREVLRGRVRLRLRTGTEVPDGATEVRRDDDGTVHVAPHGNLAEWVARVPSDALVSAEIGTVHLEDLYRLLTEGSPA
jgi:polyether ionophore transport system ATP-binding protein